MRRKKGSLSNEHEGREISGTTGDDLIIGTNGNDTIRADLGDDVIYGKGGDDVIESDDLFFPGDDKVFGGKGDDTISLGRGTDIADGGTGDDTITVSSAEPLIPFLRDDGVDTVLFNFSSSGKSFGNDTVHQLQRNDALVFLDKSGKIDSLEDLDARTRLIDVGENAYKIEWLKGDQSVTLHLDVTLANFEARPNTVDWDNFTTLQELAEIVDFRFDYDYA